MRHIRYIPLVGTDAYTIVVTDDWNGQLEDHPSIIEHPEFYEIADCEIPEKFQFLIYQSS